MTIDKAQLKALAEAATPGPWHAENDRHEGSINADYRHIGMVSMFCRVREDVERNFANQRFIAAANPATTLALLAEIERLELIGRISCNFDGYKAVLDERDQLKAENEALRKEREGMVLVPEAPSEGLLMSMAIRQDHGLGVPGYYDQPLMQRANHGVSHARMVECALSDMRKLHEEVVGSGFYSPGKESDYAAMAKEASHG